MRIACPPLIYACPFVGFSASNALELITRRIIKELEGMRIRTWRNMLLPVLRNTIRWLVLLQSVSVSVH